MLRPSKSKTPKRIKAQARIPHPELCALVAAAQAGDRSARDRVVVANLALVRNVASKFARLTAIPFEDLVQIGVAGDGSGNSGLMRAIMLFDPERGTQFSTYAGSWISAAISEAVNAGPGPVRLPPRVTTRRRKLERETAKGRTVAEVAAEIGISESEARRILRAAPRPPVAITTQGETELAEERMGETLTDPNDVAPDVRMMRHEDRTRLHLAIRQLDPLDRAVLAAHYGLDIECDSSLAEVAQHYEASREWIRKIELRAVARLREIMSAETD